MNAYFDLYCTNDEDTASIIVLMNDTDRDCGQCMNNSVLECRKHCGASVMVHFASRSIPSRKNSPTDNIYNWCMVKPVTFLQVKSSESHRITILTFYHIVSFISTNIRHNLLFVELLN